MVVNLVKKIALLITILLIVWVLFALAQDVDTFILTVNVPGDSPANETVALLDMLAERNVSATFFVPGNWMIEHEAIVRRIATEHELACYTLNETRLAPLGLDELRQEISGCAEAFAEFNVVGFRAPANDVGENSYGLIAEHFLYDSSMYRRYEWFWEEPPVVEVPVTSVLVMPLDDRIGIGVFRLNDLFFSLARRAKQDTVVMAVHVDSVQEHLLDLEFLLAHYKKEGTHVTTIREWFQSQT